MLAQVNLRVRDIPARVQALVGGIDDLVSALARWIVRSCGCGRGGVPGPGPIGPAGH